MVYFPRGTIWLVCFQIKDLNMSQWKAPYLRRWHWFERQPLDCSYVELFFVTDFMTSHLLHHERSVVQLWPLSSLLLCNCLIKSPFNQDLMGRLGAFLKPRTFSCTDRVGDWSVFPGPRLTDLSGSPAAVMFLFPVPGEHNHTNVPMSLNSIRSR